MRSSSAFSLQAAAEKPLPTVAETTHQRLCSYPSTAWRRRLVYERKRVSKFCSSPKKKQWRFTISPVQTLDLAFNLVQYRTCSVPELRPGKKLSICLHIKFFVSFSSTSKASSSGVNFSFEPLGFNAGCGMPGCPTTHGGLCFSTL